MKILMQATKGSSRRIVRTMCGLPELCSLSLPAEAEGVEVLVGELVVSAECETLLEGFLNEEERSRVARFRFERDRRRYVATRGTLRRLLGQRLGLDPTAVCFRVGSHGKPALEGDSPLRFNVSHSGDRALFAFADAHREIGVDLESAVRLGDTRDLAALAARTLTPTDAARWRSLPETEQPGAFLRAWTRIEAYGKATGQGLGDALGTVGVTFRTGEAARLLGSLATRWQLFDLALGEGWAGALVVSCPL